MLLGAVCQCVREGRAWSIAPGPDATSFPLHRTPRWEGLVRSPGVCSLGVSQAGSSEPALGPAPGEFHEHRVGWCLSKWEIIIIFL